MPDGTPPRATVRAYVEGLDARDRALVGEHVLASVRDAGYALANPFGAVDAGIRGTLAGSGIDVPATHVAAFPHRSLHARSHPDPGGTLILLDTGLRALLDRVADTLVASQLTAPGEQDGAPRRRRDAADAAFAETVVAYLDREPGRPRPGAPAPDSFDCLMARSAERFVLGHEYGHLLAGHRHTAPDGDPGTARREYEADELAAMLLLRGVDGGTEFRRRAPAVAGPFLLLAVEQLVDRVRGAPDGRHAPPAYRTDVLRRIFERAGARGLLHYAEAWVSSLALRESAVVRRARG